MNRKWTRFNWSKLPPTFYSYSRMALEECVLMVVQVTLVSFHFVWWHKDGQDNQQTAVFRSPVKAGMSTFWRRIDALYLSRNLFVLVHATLICSSVLQRKNPIAFDRYLSWHTFDFTGRRRFCCCCWCCCLCCGKILQNWSQRKWPSL